MTGAVPASHVKLKRAYEPPAAEDGARVLIDRLWPRGVKKEALALDHWAKELAPSTELRKWFNHDPALWDEFQKRFAAELNGHAESLEALEALRTQALGGTVTLVYAAHDEAHNNAVVVRDVLLAGGAID